MSEPHDYGCNCLECLKECGDVEDGATECRECGQVGGHAPGCMLVADNAGKRFPESMGPQ